MPTWMGPRPSTPSREDADNRGAAGATVVGVVGLGATVVGLAVVVVAGAAVVDVVDVVDVVGAGSAPGGVAASVPHAAVTSVRRAALSRRLMAPIVRPPGHRGVAVT